MVSAPLPAIHGLATALAALVDDGPYDVADVVARLLADCATATGSEAVALMVHDGGGRLALVGATSHRASQLEMLQIQRSSGPCVDTIKLGASVVESGADALVERWGSVGQAIVAAGFHRVETHPVRWRGDTLGGLNFFQVEEQAAQLAELGQAFADAATLVLASSSRSSVQEVQSRVDEALEARDVVEQAKGVLAETEGLDMERAYDELLRRSRTTSESLTAVAKAVVRSRGRG